MCQVANVWVKLQIENATNSFWFCILQFQLFLSYEPNSSEDKTITIFDVTNVSIILASFLADDNDDDMHEKVLLIDHILL
jgi:hypothetical protein